MAQSLGVPRAARIDFPGALHHVMFHGIEGRRMFLDDADRRALLDRLAALIALGDRLKTGQS